MVFPVERASGATPDPFDEMVLECALSARADAIVSGDKKHLLVLEEFRGIPILSPGDFLKYHERSRTKDARPESSDLSDVNNKCNISICERSFTGK